MIKFKYIIIFCGIVFRSVGQETLSLQQAIEFALKTNYQITIARQQSDIAKNNNTLGNAGFSPTLSANVNGTFSNNSTKQDYSSGLTINSNGVQSQNVNSGLLLNWVIFDGLKMFATHNKLKELQALGDYNAKIQIENAVAGIMNAYYNIVQQQQMIKATDEAIRLAEERYKIAQKKFEIGSGNKLDMLQAQVDLNAQKSNLIKQKMTVDNLKVQLNQLMGANVDKNYTVNDTIFIAYKPGYDELKGAMVKNNSSLLYWEHNINVANYATREVNSLRLPQVSLNAAYNFTRSKNQVGFVLLNQNLGLNTGFSATWNLFTGLKNRISYKNAQVQQFIAKIQYDQNKNTVEASVLMAWYNLKATEELLKLEEENILVARENATVALERFKLGSSTNIELILAQNSLVDANARLILARFGAKTSEIELMRLNGALVK